MRRDRRLVMTVLALVAGVACQGPTGVGAADARFDGDWTYRAEQSGAAVTVEGVLALTGGDVGSISGSLDAQQVDAVGTRTPFPGLVAGTVTAAGAARLDVSLPSGRVRTHLVHLRGDSLVGDWIESGGAPAAGTFRAVRGTR